MGRSRRGRGHGRGPGGRSDNLGETGNAPPGFERIRESGNGNCLFNAIARQALGDDRLAHRVRAEVCNFMETNLVPSALETGHSVLIEEHMRMIHAQREELLQFGSRDDSRVLQYTQKMRKNGEWGTGLEALCAAYCFQRPVHVWSPTGYSELRPPPNLSATGNTCEPIRLLHNGRNHWDSARPVAVHRNVVNRDVASSSDQPKAEDDPVVLLTLDEDERSARRRAALAAAEARERCCANRGIGNPSRSRSAQTQLPQKASGTDQHEQEHGKQTNTDEANAMPTASNASSGGRWARRRESRFSGGAIDANNPTTSQLQTQPCQDADGTATADANNVRLSNVSELEECVAALRRVGLSSAEAAEALERNDRNIELVKALYCIDWDAGGRTIQSPFATSLVIG